MSVAISKTFPSDDMSQYTTVLRTQSPEEYGKLPVLWNPGLPSRCVRKLKRIREIGFFGRPKRHVSEKRTPSALQNEDIILQTQLAGEDPAISRINDSALFPSYTVTYQTPEQVNLLFKILPLDITYVDENDQVVFYNRGEERLFPRSKNIIGREVRYCHPPKSVDTVLRILEEFKKGTKDVADFRIYVKGRFILIRYFAVRDNDGTYRGVVEMSQDITDIQAMEGEQRLLDWD